MITIITQRFLKKVFKDKLFSIVFSSGLFLNIIAWLIIILRIDPQIDMVYLHYNIYFGIDLIGSYFKLYFMPASGLIILLLNTFLSVILYSKERVVSYFLIIANTGAQVFLLVATILIVLLNS